MFRSSSTADHPTTAGCRLVLWPLVSSAGEVWLLAVAADDLWDNDQPELWHRLLEGASSPICEVLGIQQRQWLQQQLKDSKAALNVIASGSVLAGGRGGSKLHVAASFSTGPLLPHMCWTRLALTSCRQGRCCCYV